LNKKNENARNCNVTDNHSEMLASEVEQI